jgi:hypothetical protein
MGGSMMAAHAPTGNTGNTGNTVAQNIKGLMGKEVIDHSEISARYIYPLRLSAAAGLRNDAQSRHIHAGEIWWPSGENA